MKRKLMLYILGALIFIFLFITLLFYGINSYQNEVNAKTNLRIYNEFLKNTVKNDKEHTYDLIETMKEEEIRVTLIDKYGEVAFDTAFSSEDLDNHNDREEVIIAKEQGEGYSIRYSKDSKANAIYYASILDDGTIIRTSKTLMDVHRLSGPYIVYYLIAILSILLISLWLSVKLSYIIVKPIMDLDTMTSMIAKGELNRRVIVNSQDELGQLGMNFNYMADKLENTLNEVKEKQNRLTAILQSMENGVVAIDNNNKIIIINNYAKNIFNIEEDVVGKNISKVSTDFDLASIFSGIDAEFTEIRISRPHLKELRVRTADIINRSQHIGAVAVIQDITEIKKLENVRTEFVANVTHELKTPLTSIKGFAETLRYVDDVETRDKFLNIINDEAERLTRLISDILLLSDIEQHRENKKEKVDVNKSICDVYNLIKNTADKKNITLSIVGDDVPHLIGDKDRFKQMLINLVDNGVKYCEPGDSVILSKKAEKKHCVITIEDTGNGIPEEYIPRLFERFYRVDKARSRAKGGTGLGLAIVKHIVLSFKGTIAVESKVGIGTKFIIKIPYV
ncbi:ATP-binding protein [Clostridium sp.]|uniref:HAMP domain-containing sensor histidine kinase n=1 Tax=Clostridium sp. TaxID=1506 RepID=UPI002FCB0E8F